MTPPDRRRAGLIGQLPDAHAVALRLHEASYGEEVIATALGIDIRGVPDLLVVARAKLNRLDASSSGDGRADRS